MTNKKKEVLTPEEFNKVKEMDGRIGAILDLKEELERFKVGDVYVEQYEYARENKADVRKNRLGFPVKFKVVHISSRGIPVLKELSASGKPTGYPRFPHIIDSLRWGSNNYNNYQAQPGVSGRFITDPEALDSILLENEFDPTAGQKEANQIWNAVTKHNRRVAVKTWPSERVDEFMTQLKPGDKFWTSPVNFFAVQSVQNGQVTALDKNSASHTLDRFWFLRRRLYSECPRSYKAELPNQNLI